MEKMQCAAFLVDPEGGHPAYDYKADRDVLVDGGRGAFTDDELNKRYSDLMCEVGRRVNDGMILPGDFKKKKDKEGCIVA
jgi:hypothetical protein